MENIKLYINASIEDVKNYLEKLMEFINKSYPIFDEIYLKMINSTSKSSYWSQIFDKLNVFSNFMINKGKDNNIFINTISFLLFGYQNTYNKINPISVNLEQYEKSSYSSDIVNFRNCIIIIIIQIFINNECKDNINKDYFINSINRIIKSSYIKKSIHVIKSLLTKNINNENYTFTLSLFYFIYKKYQKFFIEFLDSDNCNIKKEYKNILIKEYQLFTYDESGVINYSNQIFEIKLSYSLLGLNPTNDKINKFLETIKDKKLKGELLEVFQNYYYNLIKNDNSNDDDKNKRNKFINILKEVQTIKKNIKEVRNNVEELKNMQNNYMDDIFRVLNIMNKQ